MKSGKRKRRWKRVALGGGALLLIAVLLYALSLPPTSEYEFLDGRRPSHIEIFGPFHRWPSGVVDYYWVFEADFQDIAKRAEKEIVDNRGGTTDTPVPSKGGWHADIGNRRIVIWDARFNRDPMRRPEFGSGWVPVIIREGRKSTPPERLRGWFQDRGM